MMIETILDRKSDHIVSIDISLTLEFAADLMMRHGIGALIVTEKGQPVGLLSERDLIGAMADSGPHAAETPIRQLMAGPVLAVSPQESLNRVMRLMTARRIRHLPVIEDEELVGIVSLGDVIKYRLDEMEMESNVLRDLAIAGR